MKKKNWIYVGIGLIVLIVIVQYIKNREWYLDFGGEEKSGASGMGRKMCTCQGKFNGYCWNLTPWSDCCERKCRNKILSTWDT